jgi:hypothetical protein
MLFRSRMSTYVLARLELDLEFKLILKKIVCERVRFRM